MIEDSGPRLGGRKLLWHWLIFRSLTIVSFIANSTIESEMDWSFYQSYLYRCGNTERINEIIDRWDRCLRYLHDNKTAAIGRSSISNFFFSRYMNKYRLERWKDPEGTLEPWLPWGRVGWTSNVKKGFEGKKIIHRNDDAGCATNDCGYRT